MCIRDSIEIVDGVLPSVLIEAPPDSNVQLDQKLDPQKKLPLKAVVACPNVTDPQVTYAWSATSISDPQLSPDLSLASTTGASGPLLVIRELQLVPGGQYIFTVVATCNDQQATSSLTINMNQRPWAGMLEVSEGPYTAGITTIALNAKGFVDYLDDYPLSYTFSYLSLIHI